MPRQNYDPTRALRAEGLRYLRSARHMRLSGSHPDSVGRRMHLARFCYEAAARAALVRFQHAHPTATV